MKRNDYTYVCIGNGLYMRSERRTEEDLISLRMSLATAKPLPRCDHERHPDGSPTCKCGKA